MAVRIPPFLLGCALLAACDRTAARDPDAAVAAQDRAQAQTRREGERIGARAYDNVRTDALEGRLSALELEVATLQRTLKEKQIEALVPDATLANSAAAVLPPLPSVTLPPLKPPPASPATKRAPRGKPAEPAKGAAPKPVKVQTPAAAAADARGSAGASPKPAPDGD